MSPATMSDRDFRREVLLEQAPVLVAFRAGWCAQSRGLAPAVDQLERTFAGRAKIMTVDVPGDPREHRLCARYGITRLPVSMVFHEGEPRDLIGGATSVGSLQAMVERRLRPVLDVGEHDFDAEVVRSKRPVLAHFGAAWCDVSRKLEPLVTSVAERYRGRAKTVRVEFGPATARLCARYGVTRVPTLALLEGGVVRDRIFGAVEGGPRNSVSLMLDELTG